MRTAKLVVTAAGASPEILQSAEDAAWAYFDEVGVSAWNAAYANGKSEETFTPLTADEVEDANAWDRAHGLVTEVVNRGHENPYRAVYLEMHEVEPGEVVSRQIAVPEFGDDDDDDEATASQPPENVVVVR